MAVLALRPTQFVLGMKEVEYKVALMQGLKDAKLEDYVEAHPVPVILGPTETFYMIDHHHFVAAAWRMGLKKVKTVEQADARDLDQTEFWTLMRTKNWLYLYDQFGQGPHDPNDLPLDIRGLSDDIYRSLAWELRRAGVITKEQQPFAEFKWAQLLRSTLKLDLHGKGYAAAVKEAIALAQGQLAVQAQATKPK